MEERKGGFVDWLKSSLGGLTEWALSSALRATHGLFGSKSASGGNTTVNEQGRTIHKLERHDETIDERIVRLKKKK